MGAMALVAASSMRRRRWRLVALVLLVGIVGAGAGSRLRPGHVGRVRRSNGSMRRVEPRRSSSPRVRSRLLPSYRPCVRVTA